MDDWELPSDVQSWMMSLTVRTCFGDGSRKKAVDLYSEGSGRSQMKSLDQ